MKIFKIVYWLFGTLVLMTSCGPSNPVFHNNLNIVLTDSLTVDYQDESRRIPAALQDLCAVLTSDAKDCKRTHILDPSIMRLDLGKELALKTTIEKGGAKNIENPKVIGKLIQKHLDELDVPREFTNKKAPGVDDYKLISEYVAAQSAKDSILVYSEGGTLESYSLNGRTYKPFASLDEVRNKMLAILCQNDKARFILLMNPSAAKNTLVTPPRSSKPIVLINRNNTTQITISRPKGNLTIIKGSEGCDVCTRYYSATDQAGRTHEIREENSTHCCPCGQIVQIRGVTYRMDCNKGGGNKLTQVE